MAAGQTPDRPTKASLNICWIDTLDRLILAWLDLYSRSNKNNRSILGVQHGNPRH
jgi:hypothetical protein